MCKHLDVYNCNQSAKCVQKVFGKLHNCDKCDKWLKCFLCRLFLCPPQNSLSRRPATLCPRWRWHWWRWHWFKNINQRWRECSGDDPAPPLLAPHCLQLLHFPHATKFFPEEHQARCSFDAKVSPKKMIVKKASIYDFQGPGVWRFSLPVAIRRLRCSWPPSSTSPGQPRSRREHF